MALAAGADAIIVSNHGGRQLDGASSTVSALPRIADAVGNATEIILDSGVRRGADMLKALALGARACFIGKAALYGLAVGGEAGVTRVIELFAPGTRSTTLALCGSAPASRRWDRTLVEEPGRARRARRPALG